MLCQQRLSMPANIIRTVNTEEGPGYKACLLCSNQGYFQ